MLKKSVSLSVVALATAAAIASSAAAATMDNTTPAFWWPDRLDLSQLRDHDPKSNPMGDFDYAEAVKQVDFDAVKKDIEVAAEALAKAKRLVASRLRSLWSVLY